MKKSIFIPYLCLIFSMFSGNVFSQKAFQKYFCEIDTTYNGKEKIAKYSLKKNSIWGTPNTFVSSSSPMGRIQGMAINRSSNFVYYSGVSNLKTFNTAQIFNTHNIDSSGKSISRISRTDVKFNINENASTTAFNNITYATDLKPKPIALGTIVLGVTNFQTSNNRGNIFTAENFYETNSQVFDTKNDTFKSTSSMGGFQTYPGDKVKYIDTLKSLNSAEYTGWIIEIDRLNNGFQKRRFDMGRAPRKAIYVNSIRQTSSGTNATINTTYQVLGENELNVLIKTQLVNSVQEFYVYSESENKNGVHWTLVNKIVKGTVMPLNKPALTNVFKHIATDTSLEFSYFLNITDFAFNSTTNSLILLSPGGIADISAFTSKYSIAKQPNLMSYLSSYLANGKITDVLGAIIEIDLDDVATITKCGITNSTGKFFSNPHKISLVNINYNDSLSKPSSTSYAIISEQVFDNSKGQNPKGKKKLIDYQNDVFLFNLANITTEETLTDLTSQPFELFQILEPNTTLTLPNYSETYFPLFNASQNNNSSTDSFNCTRGFADYFIKPFDCSNAYDTTINMDSTFIISLETNCKALSTVKFSADYTTDSIRIQRYNKSKSSWELVLQADTSLKNLSFISPLDTQIYEIQFRIQFSAGPKKWKNWSATKKYTIFVDTLLPIAISGDHKSKYCTAEDYVFYDSNDFNKNVKSIWKFNDTIISDTSVNSFKIKFNQFSSSNHLKLMQWNEKGCYVVDSIHLMSVDKLQLIFNTDSACQGQKINIKPNVKLLDSTSWFVDQQLFSTASDSIILDNLNMGKHMISVFATDEFNCKQSVENRAIQIIEKSNLSLISSKDTACFGDDFIIKTNIALQDSNLWLINSTPFANLDSINLKGYLTGNYKIQLTCKDKFGCSHDLLDSNNVIKTKSNLLLVKSADSLCFGSSEFITTSNKLIGFNTWSINGVETLYNQDTMFLNQLLPNNYKINFKGTDIEGCDHNITDSVTTILEIPQKPIFTYSGYTKFVGDTVVFEMPNTNFNSWVYIDGIKTSIPSKSKFTYISDSLKTVNFTFVTENEFCASDTQQIILVFDKVNEISTFNLDAFSIHPNPIQSGSTVYIKSSKIVQSIQLYSSDGRLLLDKVNINNEINSEINQLKSGVYYISINHQSNSKKLIILN